MSTVDIVGDGVPADVAGRIDRYLSDVDSAVSGLVTGAYLTGSAVLGDFRPGRSDIDLVLVTDRPLAALDSEPLTAVHAAQPTQPYLDGVYLPRPWLAGVPAGAGTGLVVDGVFSPAVPDAISPVDLLTLARYARAVRGPAPSTLDIVVSVESLRGYNLANLRDYWQGEADRTRARLAGRAHDGEVPAYPVAWLVLGAARLHHTLGSGDIVSKSAAGYHVEVTFPGYADLARRAVAWRHGEPVAFTVADGLAAADLVDTVVRDAWHRWG